MNPKTNYKDKNLSADAYRADSALSRSDLWTLRKSPLHFHYERYNAEHVDTPALIFGTAAHKYMLEPASFYDEIAVAPEVDRRTKEGKVMYAAFLEKAEGKKAITLGDLEVIEEMRTQMLRNPLAAQLLKGDHEVSYFWTDPDTGVRCKCRPDCITELDGIPYIVDYKTTDSCEDGHFERSCRKYGYQLQAGMYTEGTFQVDLTEYGFAFVAQEKTPPYATRVYLCDPEWIARGYDQFRQLIGLYHNCAVTDNWYGYEGPDGLPETLTEED